MNNPVQNEAEILAVEAKVRKINNLVHWLLIIGLTASALLMLTGVALEVMQRGQLPEAMVPLDQLAAELPLMRPAALLSLGLLVLIATPIVRVAGSLIGFLFERDWRYALVTFVVLTIVVISILLGRA